MVYRRGSRPRERTTRVPEVSGGYSVITVPSREPANQTKRDKDKQRSEPTRRPSAIGGRETERIKRRHAERNARREKQEETRMKGEREENGDVRAKRISKRGGGGSMGTGEGTRSGPSLSMTCDRFLLCDSLQLAATPRQPLRFPSSSSRLLSRAFSPARSLLLIFVPRRPRLRRAPLCNRGTMYWAPFVVDRSTRPDSIGGPEKGPTRPDKDDAATDSGDRRAKRRGGPGTCQHALRNVTSISLRIIRRGRLFAYVIATCY